MNKKNYFNFAILFLLVILLSEKTNFTRSVYDILKLKYYERLVKRYDYCSKDGVGYILELKNKFDLAKINPKVVNFRSSPIPKWLFFNTSSEVSNEFIIFLNYETYVIQKFTKKNDYFSSKDRVYEIDTIKKIRFKLFNGSENFNGNLNIYNQKKNKLSLIKKIKFNQSNFDGNNLVINFSNKKISGKRQNSLEEDPGALVFKIENNNKNFINLNEIDVFFDRSKELKNYQILDSNQNCYFARIND